MLPHVSTDFQKKGNVKDATKYRDLNEHLKAETEVIESNYLMPMENSTIQPVFFEKIENTTLSRFQFQITTVIDFAPFKIFNSLIEYVRN